MEAAIPLLRRPCRAPGGRRPGSSLEGASQLRDSAGFSPDFASHTAPGADPGWTRLAPYVVAGAGGSPRKKVLEP